MKRKFKSILNLFYRTLIDSTPGVLQAWKTFSEDYSLGDSVAIAHKTHGRRLYETLKEYCNIKDEDTLKVYRKYITIWLNLCTHLLGRNRPFRGPGDRRWTDAFTWRD